MSLIKHLCISIDIIIWFVPLFSSCNEITFVDFSIKLTLHSFLYMPIFNLLQFCLVMCFYFVSEIGLFFHITLKPDFLSKYWKPHKMIWRMFLLFLSYGSLWKTGITFALKVWWNFQQNFLGLLFLLWKILNYRFNTLVTKRLLRLPVFSLESILVNFLIYWLWSCTYYLLHI